MGSFFDILNSLMNIGEMEQDIANLKKEIANLKRQIQENNIVIVNPENVNPKNEPTPPQVSKSAKEAFIDNLTLVKPILENLTDGSFQGEKWNELISSLESNELVSIWSRINGKAESVMRILAVWGLKPELCTSFTCTGNEEEMYYEPNSDNLEQGAKYDVVKNCWLLTDNEGKKSVVVKGKVKKHCE